MHATRCAVSQTLNTSPGALVFGRDMFLELPVIADLITIRDRRQHLVDENLHRQNLKSKEYDYAVGHEVLIKAVNPESLSLKHMDLMR
eukprot:8738115-Ditylum_brightwellii.AAC.1